MKIKMAKHVNGKVNGVVMGPYILGLEYSVPDEIDQARADLFLGSAMAEVVIDPPIIIEPIETVTILTIGEEFPEEIGVEHDGKVFRKSRKIGN